MRHLMTDAYRGDAARAAKSARVVRCGKVYKKERIYNIVFGMSSCLTDVKTKPIISRSAYKVQGGFFTGG